MRFWTFLSSTMQNPASSNADTVSSVASTPSSIRSISKGQFNKYKQLFDSLLRSKSKEKHQQSETEFSSAYSSSLSSTSSSSPSTLSSQKSSHQLTDDEVANFMRQLEVDSTRSSPPLSSQGERNTTSLSPASASSQSLDDTEQATQLSSSMAAVFYGLSDETSSMLNTLISSNRQIADFFEKPPRQQEGERGDEVAKHSTDALYSSVYSSSLSSLSPSSKSTDSSVIKAIDSNIPANTVATPTITHTRVIIIISVRIHMDSNVFITGKIGKKVLKKHSLVNCRAIFMEFIYWEIGTSPVCEPIWAMAL